MTQLWKSSCGSGVLWEIEKYYRNKECLELSEAVATIRNPRLRRLVIQIVEEIAREQSRFSAK